MEHHTVAELSLGAEYGVNKGVMQIGGERGIRTPGGLPLNGFQDRRFRPLSQLSEVLMAKALKLMQPSIFYNVEWFFAALREVAQHTRVA